MNMCLYGHYILAYAHEPFKVFLKAKPYLNTMAPKAGLCSGALPWMACAHTVSRTRMLTAHVVRQATLHSFLVRELVF